MMRGRIMKNVNRKRTKRRQFIKDSLFAVAAGAIGVRGLSQAAGPSFATARTFETVEILMNSAAAQFAFTKAYLDGIAKQIRAIADGTKVPKDHLTDAECQKILSIVGAIVAVVVVVVIAIVVSVFTFGAGATHSRKIVSAISELTTWAANMERQGKMTPEIAASVEKARKLLENARDATASLDFYVHVAKDKSHASKLLAAVRARNAAAVKEIIRLDIPGSTVDVSEVKDESGISITFRVNTITHCLSTAAGCGGRITPVL